ncbi:MAG TPA: hypothetical protein VMF32_19195 [Xanthobacteraceae bacterium]|nr:hypothetical protein [Xanthobacteraceae bacterium]
MRTLLTASLAAATVCLFAAAGSAAPITGALHQKATPRVQLAQYGGGGYEHPHHYCRPYWHWACHYGECRCYRD